LLWYYEGVSCFFYFMKEKSGLIAFSFYDTGIYFLASVSSGLVQFSLE
jgi:hypothetical protein